MTETRQAFFGSLWTTLELTGVPIEEILIQMERQGMTTSALVGRTKDFLPSCRGKRASENATMLVFGCIRRWQNMLPQARALVGGWIRDLLERGEFAVRLNWKASPGSSERIRLRILHRLGYPQCLTKTLTVEVKRHKQHRDLREFPGGLRESWISKQ